MGVAGIGSAFRVRARSTQSIRFITKCMEEWRPQLYDIWRVCWRWRILCRWEEI